MDKDLKHLSPQIYRTRGERERKKFRQGSHVRGSWPCAGSFTQHVLLSPWADLAPAQAQCAGTGETVPFTKWVFLSQAWSKNRMWRSDIWVWRVFKVCSFTEQTIHRKLTVCQAPCLAPRVQGFPRLQETSNWLAADSVLVMPLFPFSF